MPDLRFHVPSPVFTDFKFALRQLAKAPGFTTVALLTLALGIGSATVVFSAINALLFKPLPLVTVPEDRLVYATQTDKARGNEDLGWSYPDYIALRARATTLEGLWIHADRTVLITGSEVPRRLVGTEISWDAFALLGVNPILGRNFAARDAEPKADNVALISAGLWQGRFGGAEDIIGRVVTLNGQPTTVIGVMPREWRYPDVTDVWTPLRPDLDKASLRGYFGFSGRARLKPGVTLAEAQAEADAITAALGQEFPESNGGIGVHYRPIRAEAVAGTEDFTLLLFGAVMFVFLIACVNVANLLLSRAVGRSKEIAVRLALGAERMRIVRQLITESIVLGLLGGIGGLVLGMWANDAMVAALPIEVPFWLRFDFDLTVFGFVCALSFIAALIFGVIPAWRVSQPDVVTELKEGGRGSDLAGPRASQLRSLLVIAEIALALVLLVGAGLMMRSFFELRRLDPGFDARNILTFRTGVPAAMFGQDPDVAARFFENLGPKLAATPGVESVGLVSWLPGRNGTGNTGAVLLEGEAQPARAIDAHLVRIRTASGSYFQTVRIPLIAGRVFDDAIDRHDSPRVVIVDETFAARRFGSAQAALGKRIYAYEDPKGGHLEKKPHVGEIIGVVGPIRHHLDRADDLPTTYISARQTRENFLSVVMRTHGDPASYDAIARDVVMSQNREIAIYDVFTLEEFMLRSDTVWPRRFFSYLFTVFGGVALFLACIGIYGVMSYNVTQRTQELGVRLALGAQPSAVIQLIVRHGLRLVIFGLGAGLVAAFFLANLLSGVLYGVSPHDPPTFAAVPLLLAAVALVACWLPSRRATLIEPNAALRAE